MKILIITQYFYPENFKSNDIAFELSKRGFEVEILTGIPNYPAGKYYNGYGILRKRTEKINGTKVYRAFLWPRGKGHGVSLALNFFSFVFSASIWVLVLSIYKRYDAIIVHEPSPITQGIPAVLFKKIRKTPIYFWVLDLWPESLISAGGIKSKRVISFFESLTRFIYKNSDKILISSRSFRQSIERKGNFNDKLIYFPNWGEDIFLSKPFYELPELPVGFRVIHAGNIGEAQDFESILKAALELKDNSNIHWIFVGDGRKKSWVNEFISTNHLSRTVHLFEALPLIAMPSLFQATDVLLVSLKDEPVFNLTVPAKLQAYMASARPVIGMLNGEGAEIISESACGAVVNAGNHKALAEVITKFSKTDSQSLDRMGQNGFEYYKTNFSKEKCIDNLCNILNQK